MRVQCLVFGVQRRRPSDFFRSPTLPYTLDSQLSAPKQEAEPCTLHLAPCTLNEGVGFQDLVVPVGELGARLRENLLQAHDRVVQRGHLLKPAPSAPANPRLLFYCLSVWGSWFVVHG